MSVAYFDCFSGAAGDMILGALIDAGAELDTVQGQLDRLEVDGCAVGAEKVTKGGLAGTQITVAGESGAGAPHRSLSDVREIIEGGSLSEPVTQRSLAIFGRLAEAEAAVHNCTVDKIHFHEVGAVDAIADIVGVSVALDALGVDRVVCSPIPVGSGTVTCAHGVLPIPAPATAKLLEGVPLADCEEVGELTTPTGAAILTTVAESFGPLPAMTIERVGYGAGRREGRHRPNLLRAILGSPVGGAEADEILILEANIDDASPEVVAYSIERLLDAGALDAYCTPIYMKKSRLGMLVTVLASPDRVTDIEQVLFAETTTLGVRRHGARRSKLAREIVQVETSFGPIGVKVGLRGGEVVTAAPEFEDCRAAARREDVALRVVMEAARAAWRDRK